MIKIDSSTMDQSEPHKPIPSTDAKELAGPSCSTRSKVKRTLHSGSDNYCSRSQSHQPLFKTQTRLRPKQVSRSVVGINHDDTTPDSNSIDTNTVTVDEYTPAQTALQNDLVLESLFSYMNRSDVLNCRIVNNQWQFEATKELRRRKLVIRFSFQSKGNQMSRNIAFQDICRRLSECRTPSLLSSFQVKADASNDLGSAGVGSIFTTVGNQMKQLTLHLDYLSKRSFLERNFLMTHLENLLFRQAPNLEFLEITFDFPSHWKDELQTLTLDHHQNDNSNEFLLLPKLRTFIVNGSPPLQFFASVMTAAVNLRTVGGSWSACIKYLMGAEGRAKIHLLKSLSFQLALHPSNRWNELDIELLESFVTEHRQNLQLESIECVSEFIREDAPFTPRIVNAINQILEGSSGSLLKLRIEPAKWFYDLLVIPSLPKLQEISIDCFWSSHVRVDGGGPRPGGGSFFPRGLNMKNSFQNISTIILLRCAAFLFRLFVSNMEIEMTEPVASIRFIILNDRGRKGNIVPPHCPAAVTDFHHVFPNLVSVSYVGNEKYHNI